MRPCRTRWMPSGPHADPVAGSSSTPLVGANIRVFQCVPEPAKQLTPSSVSRPSAEVGLERRDLFLAAELEEDVVRPEVVYLDGQLRAHAEQLLQLFRLFERLPVRYRLLHPAEHDARAFALEGDGNHTGLGLEPDLCELERSAEDERRAENGMPGEGQLHLRREDPDPRVPA